MAIRLRIARAADKEVDVATIYKRTGSTKFWLRYSVDGQDVRESSGTDDREEAEAILTRKVRENEHAAERTTYREAAVRFFKETRVKPKTKKCYLTSARNWDPFLSRLYLDEINKKVIAGFIEIRKSWVHDSTIRRDLAYLSSLFSHASTWQHGPEINPVMMYNKRKLQEADKRTRTLTEDEKFRLLGACISKVHGEIVEFALETGMRSGEIAGLTWDRVDLDRKEVTLRMVDTKTTAARVIPLSKRAVTIMLGTARCGSYVFHHDKGQPFTTFKNFWGPLCRRAKIEDLRFHDLRHDFASRWMRAGRNEKALSTILGHKTREMTDRYSHLRTEDLHREMAQLEAQTH